MFQCDQALWTRIRFCSLAGLTAIGIGALVSCTTDTSEMKTTPIADGAHGQTSAQIATNLADTSATNPEIPPSEHERIVNYVQQRQDPRVIRKSLQTSPSETVDCLDIHLQHGFDNPISAFAEPPTTAPSAPGAPGGPVGVQPLNSRIQSYGTNSELCPEGTVPRVRVTVARIEKFGSLDAFLGIGPANPKKVKFPVVDAHKYATYAQNVANDGATTIINFWDPHVERSGDFSFLNSG